MLVGGVVRHQVQDQIHPSPVNLTQQPVEIIHRAEQRVDGGVVGHIVAKIVHRRGVNGGNPDSVNIETLEVI